MLTGIDQNVATNRHLWASMETMVAEIRGMRTDFDAARPVAAAQPATVEARAYAVQTVPADLVSEAVWEALTTENAPRLAALAPLRVQTRIAAPTQPAAAPEAPTQPEPSSVSFESFSAPTMAPRPAQPERVLITGNTYRVRNTLRFECGGQWDAAQKGWWVPAEREVMARTIVARGY